LRKILPSIKFITQLILSSTFVKKEFLQKKMNVIVTGGTKGIGRALVLKFGKEGHDVYTCARNASDLKKLEKEFKKISKHKIYTQVADVSEREELNKFADAIKKQCKKIEVLINNAGVFLPGQIHNEAEGVFEKQLNTNLASAYHLTRALLPIIIEQKSGHIFNLCSTASIMAYPNGGSYSISKFALLGFTKVLREELKNKNIKVTAVLPGATLTHSWKGTTHPETRFMKDEDIAKTIYDIYQLKTAVVEEILLRPQLGDI
jgi:short-subunit dehydrogenase